ncbi:hypothetical protein L1987_34423 [Smallanthus sonchifolius]|uniref:Uncharacterized protein n=1 Tax=Smallanthus sonchifolius TaxID=185202 RepID=A0ACB9HT20_9ASTR|nr:hypothetical protein L1987_34423 [Smallanthus sonchifolius]
MDLNSPHTPSQETLTPIRPLQMNSPTPAGGSAKIATPDRLTVPKAFKYPEMYKSPTDQIMSPVSKGLLARTKSRKSSALLPSSFTRNQQHKIQASKFQDLGALKT